LVNYYQFDIISNDGNNLVYPIDLNLIYGIKYEWEPDNAGIGGGVKHATIVCVSDSDLSDSLDSITETEYNDFDQITFVTDKANISANASDSALLTATMPKGKGKVTFKCVMPDGTIKMIEKSIGANKRALSNPNDLQTSVTGQIKVTIFSDVWHTPQSPRPEVIIDAT